MSDSKGAFINLASMMEAKGIVAEAISDANGEITSLRFYMAEKAFTIRCYEREDGSVRFEIEEYEYEESEQPEERLEHVLEVLRRTELHG